MLNPLEQGQEDKHRRHLWSLQACSAATADCQSLVMRVCGVSGFEGQARVFVLPGLGGSVVTRGLKACAHNP